MTSSLKAAQPLTSDKQKNSPIALVVPTLRPGATWPKWMAAVADQSLQPSVRLMMDSGSSEPERDLARSFGFSVVEVSPGCFDHGGTRADALRHLPPAIDIVVFLTQDAILASADSLRQIVATFANPGIAAAWGRQLPHNEASPIARHARLFNYPQTSRHTTLDDRVRLGIKAAFCSNSFAAYRLSALRKVGGFPSPTVLGEDMHTAARLLKAGWKVAYAADACVYHSHNYTLREEFARYFDTGAFHADNSWLLDEFGAPQGEGKKFVYSELRYLLHKAPLSVPRALLNTVGKLAGYRLGQRYQALPPGWRLRLGMNKAHWKRFLA